MTIETKKELTNRSEDNTKKELTNRSEDNTKKVYLCKFYIS
jgi:hypothetical protein